MKVSATSMIREQDPRFHFLALVESDRVGRDTRIWPYTHVMEGAVIGAHCNIGSHCFVESGAVIGDRVTIKNGNHLWEGIHLEDDVFVGPGVCFTNDRYPRSPRLPIAAGKYATKDWLMNTRVKRGASVGAGVVIVPGVTLGAYCMVGAGAVITRDVEAHALMTGNPARQTGWVCRCGQPLKFLGGHQEASENSGNSLFGPSRCAHPRQAPDPAGGGEVPPGHPQGSLNTNLDGMVARCTHCGDGYQIELGKVRLMAGSIDV
jgi:UDP-2-acetamido-3-amino-2,3-dideoxy-glucuronate N-acetyltransferase